ncbi:N-acetylmuramoyl-L-alanine amidase [Nakamurella endophytica]|uniref:MurNAc-LAA domain-containing protein n=1 Tax=Nakamurella endophytica TaxID=1748367 RepID=A0A917T1E4_9ACTN|nr:N-acetylmuramoyl-L-alanine amidase [Nakamurella endophytica]GGM05800.1 hypothetical protein GCM10011594_27520 [Nakamurella endophytica]
MAEAHGHAARGPGRRAAGARGRRAALATGRRAALLAAGLGLALVTAACGTLPAAQPRESTGTPSPVLEASVTGPTGPQVTVPGLGGTAVPGSPTAAATTARTTTARTTAPARPTSSRPAPPRTAPAPVVVTVTTTLTPPATRATATTSADPAATAAPEPAVPTVPTVPTRGTSAPSTTPGANTAGPSRTTAAPRSTAQPSTSRAGTSRPAARGLAGKIVAIDPGHNGDNANHPEIINQKIDGGNGYENVCNTTGTETDDGYPEHAFTWHVSQYLEQELAARGIRVVLTRHSDDGVGPCTPERARIENDAHADAVVSIHGDGVDAKVRGFYVLTNGRPTDGPAMAARSLQLARAIRDGLEQVGFPASNTLGSDGLWTRDDLTGLNLSTRPKILVELGNMRNPREAATMSSPEGQRAYAHALALGVVAFLEG